MRKRRRFSTAVRLPTASALKKPAVPAKDQAILDEVAQAMEDELNSGGKKEEESSKTAGHHSKAGDYHRKRQCGFLPNNAAELGSVG